jgi:5-methylcytosine-specific restriction endonuclease McrA
MTRLHGVAETLSVDAPGTDGMVPPVTFLAARPGSERRQDGKPTLHRLLSSFLNRLRMTPRSRGGQTTIAGEHRGGTREGRLGRCDNFRLSRSTSEKPSSQDRVRLPAHPIDGVNRKPSRKDLRNEIPSHMDRRSGRAPHGGLQDARRCRMAAHATQRTGHHGDGDGGARMTMESRSAALTAPGMSTVQGRDSTVDNSTIQTKRCSKCGETKPATTEYFSGRSNRPSGLMSQCRTCKSAYYRANKERAAERWKIYSEANKDRIAEYSRAYYAANKERRLERARAWHKENLERASERNRKWRELHPEDARLIARRRRARQKEADGTHTPTDVAAQYEMQKGRCYYCGCELNGKYQTDHVIPLSRGGSDGTDNIVVACAPCNQSKGDKLPTEWVGNKSGRLL